MSDGEGDLWLVFVDEDDEPITGTFSIEHPECTLAGSLDASVNEQTVTADLWDTQQVPEELYITLEGATNRKAEPSKISGSLVFEAGSCTDMMADFEVELVI